MASNERRKSSVVEFLRKSSLDEHQLKELRELFQLCDVNKDGVVSKSELYTVMRNIGMKPTKSEFIKMFKELDSDQNGELTFEEFAAGLKWFKGSLTQVDEEVEEDPVFELQTKVDILSKYVQYVTEAAVEQAEIMVRAGDTKNAAALLKVVDLKVIKEMQTAVEAPLLSAPVLNRYKLMAAAVNAK